VSAEAAAAAKSRRGEGAAAAAAAAEAAGPLPLAIGPAAPADSGDGGARLGLRDGGVEQPLSRALRRAPSAGGEAAAAAALLSLGSALNLSTWNSEAAGNRVSGPLRPSDEGPEAILAVGLAQIRARVPAR
jgi:hypothetical protein